MDGSDRSGNRQEPMLAADMVWDSDTGQGRPRSALCIFLTCIIVLLLLHYPVMQRPPLMGCQTTRCKCKQSFVSSDKNQNLLHGD